LKLPVGYGESISLAFSRLLFEFSFFHLFQFDLPSMWSPKPFNFILSSWFSSVIHRQVSWEPQIGPHQYAKAEWSRLKQIGASNKHLHL